MSNNRARCAKIKAAVELDSCLALLLMMSPAAWAASPGGPSPSGVTPNWHNTNLPVSVSPTQNIHGAAPWHFAAHSNTGMIPKSHTLTGSHFVMGNIASHWTSLKQSQLPADLQLVRSSSAGVLNSVNFNPFDAASLLSGKASAGSFAGNSAGMLGGRSELDLMSTSRTVVLGSTLFGHTSSVSIDVGGNKQSYHAGMAVTASEYIAIMQTLSGNGQQIVLDKRGAADGGSFAINQVAGGASGLVVSKGVTAIDYISSSQQIHLTGDLINYGTIYGVSTNSKITSGTIFAKDITNENTGIISTSLPSGSLLIAGPAGQASISLNALPTPSVDLTLAATNNIVNSGAISSSGSLTLATAHGSITNALPAGPAAKPVTVNWLSNDHTAPKAVAAQAPQSTISAGSDVNLLVGNGGLVNHGLVQSTNGNINIDTPLVTTNLHVQAGEIAGKPGSTGTFSAQAGDINLHGPNYFGFSNINMSGGDYLSKQLNINAGLGAVNGYVGNVTGVTNITAGSSQFGAATPDLKLGTLNVFGDPTYYNTQGSLNLSNLPSTGGADLALIASGDVVVSSGTLDTTNAFGGNGGSLTIIAGANITSPATGSGSNDTGTTVTITNSGLSSHGSATGGAIDISGVTAISTNGTITPVNLDGSYPVQGNQGIGGNGGAVLLVAFSGTGASKWVPGSINAGTTGSINTYGGGPGSFAGNNNGNVTVIAGATSDPAGGSAVTLPAIFTGTSSTASQSGVNGGSVVIATTTPNISGTVSVHNGTVSGIVAPDLLALQPTSITIGAVGGNNPVVPPASTTAWETAADAYALNFIMTQLLLPNPSYGTNVGPPFPNLKVDPTLTADAQNEAQYLAESGRIAHFTDNGAGPQSRAIAAGVNALVIGVGENVGTGIGSGQTVSGNFSDVTNQMWYGEPNVSGTHHFNLANNPYVGIGFAYAGSQIFFVEDFATSNPATTPGGLVPPVGVVPIHAGVAAGMGIANSLGGANQTNAEPAIGGNTRIPVSINTSNSSPIFNNVHRAGDVTISAGGSVTVSGVILANGASGGASVDGAPSPGGAGGNVTITAGTNVTLGGIQSSGGMGGASGIYTTTTLAGKGGNGGIVSITATNGNITILPPAPLVNSLAIGAAGGAGGQSLSTDLAGVAGGKGGAVTLSAPAGSITVSAIDAGGGGGSGGSGGSTGGAGGDGGAGGSVSLTAPTVDVQFYVNVSGGGGGGAGGKNGTGAGGGGGGASLGIAGGGGASDHSGIAGTSIGGGGGGAVGELPGLGGPTFESFNNQSSIGTAGSTGAGGTHGDFGGGGGGGGGATAASNGGDGGALGAGGQKNGSGTLAGGAGGAGGAIVVQSAAATVDGTVQGMWDPYQIRLNGTPTTVSYTQGSDALLALGSGGSVAITGTLQLKGSGSPTVDASSVVVNGSLSALKNMTIGTGATVSSPAVTVSGPAVNLLAPGGTITFGKSTIIQSTGNVSINSAVSGILSATAAGTLSITDTGGSLNVSNLSGSAVTINGTAGQDETVNNTGTIAATSGNINITSTPNVSNKGGNLFITGGGTMNVNAGGSITLTAAQSADTLSKNNIQFQGSQTFNGTSLGTTTLTASGANQQVIVDAAAVVTGKEALTVLSPILMRTGTITGNPLIFTTGGTIADNSGAAIDLSALGPIVFHGDSLAIISKGNIIDSGSAVSIDLSNSSGQAGSLVLVAGFDFSPPSTATPIPDTTTTYTIGAAGSGNISLGNTNILTNGSTIGGNVSAFATGSVTINAITTFGGSGNSGVVTIIGSGVQVNTPINTSNPTAANAGSVTITAATVQTSGSVTIKGGSILTGAFQSNTAAGNITLAGVSAGSQTVTLTAAAATGGISSSATVTAGTLLAVSGSGGIGSSASPLKTTAGILSLNAGNAGDVFVTGSASSVLLTGVNAANNFNLVSSGSVLIGSGRTVTGTSSVALQASGSGTIDIQDSGGAINSPAVTLTTAGGAIGANNAIALTAANTTLTFNAGSGNVAITSNGALVLDPSAGNAVTVTAGSIVTNGSSSASGLLTLNTDSLTVGAGHTLTGSAVSVNGLVGDDLTFNNQGNVTATSGSVNVVSTPDGTNAGGNLDVTGGGTINVAANQTINLSAAISPDSLASNMVHFTGSQTFNGNTNVSATGNNESVVIDSGATLTVNVPFSLAFNSSSLVNKGVGNLVGSFVMNTPSGAGTYANDTGPLDLAGLNLTFHGQSLAILSAGDIVNSTGSPSTIDLSNSAGNGGRLYLLAGFSFTPTSGGITTALDTTTPYMITGPGSGAINLANTTINTSGTNLGGNVFAYANGAVSLGAINTGSGGANGGNVTIIGQGISMGGNINTGGVSPAVAGAISIISATIKTSGSLQVLNGLVSGGGFIVNTPTGNISLTGISAGAQSVALAAAAGGISSSSVLTVGHLTAVSGAQGIGSSLNPILTTASVISASGGASGDVFVKTTAAAVTLNGVNGGNNYSVALTSPSSTLVVAAGQSVNAVASAKLTATSNLTFQTGSTISAFSIDLEASSGSLTAPSTLTATTDGSGNGGSISINAKSLGWINSGSQTLILNAAGTGGGKGGTIAVATQDNQTLGSSAGQIQMVATSGGTGSGSGGSASFTTSGALFVTTDGLGNIPSSVINVGPTGLTGNGGAIALSAGILNWTSAKSSSFNLTSVAAGGGSGGSVSIALTGASPATATIGSGAGDFNLTATGANGGSASFSTSGILDIITDASGNAMGFAQSGLNIAPTGANGNGGSVQLTAKTFNWGQSGSGNKTVLFVNADAATGGTGFGGFVAVNQTSTAGATIGNSAAGQFDLSTHGGNNGSLPNGSGVSFASGGNLVVNTSGINVSPGSSGAAGENIILQSNSATVFNVGLNTTANKNGVKGSLNVLGNGSGASGSLTFINAGGGVTNSVAITAVSNLTMTAGGKGGVVVGQNIGSAGTVGVPGTLSINLSDTGSGTITSSKTIITDATSGLLKLSSSTGSIGALTFTSKNVSANSTGASVTLTDKFVGTANILSSSSGAAKTFSFTETSGSISTSGSITGGTGLTLKTTTTTAGAGGIALGANLDAIGTTGTKVITGAGIVTVTASTGDITIKSGAPDVSATKAVTMTATKGSLTVDTVGLTNTPTTATLTAFNNLTNSGTVKALTTITEKTTNAGSTKAPSTSTINVQGNIETTSATANTGAISLTDSGNGGITNNGTSDIGAGKSVTLSAAKGSITVNTVGQAAGAKSPGTVSLSALTNITNTGTMSALTSVTEKTTASNVQSEIDVAGNINVTGATGVVTLTNGGSPVASSGIVATSNISALKSVTLSATKGDISFSDIGSVLSPAGIVKATSLGALVETGSINAGTNVSLSATSSGTKAGTPTGSVTVNNITTGTATSGGAISVIAAGGVLSVDPGAVISAISAKTTVKATITLENKLITGLTPGSISIGGSAQIMTGGPGGGNINIVMGSVPGSPTGTTLTPQTGVNFNPSGSPSTQIFLGSPAVTFAGMGPGNQIDINATGSPTIKVIFSNGGLPTSAITVNAGLGGANPDTLIKADPPLMSPATVSMGHSSLAALPGLTAEHSPLSAVPGPAQSPAIVIANLSTHDLTNVPPGLLSPRLPLAPYQNQLVNQASNQPAWISDTEIASGEIPALMCSGLALNVVPEVSAVVDLQKSADSSTLNRGAVLFAPTVATRVSTPCGVVSIDAGSLVLVMAWSEGLAVYDLHDRHGEAVTVACSGRAIKLFPGMHAVITNQSVTSFGDINPAQKFGYRNMQQVPLGGGFKAFKSEFSLPVAMQMVLPLKQLVGARSNSPAQRLANRLIKTAAVINDMALSGEQFQQFARAPVTCMRQ